MQGGTVNYFAILGFTAALVVAAVYTYLGTLYRGRGYLGQACVGIGFAVFFLPRVVGWPAGDEVVSLTGLVLAVIGGLIYTYKRRLLHVAR
jgi:hypothetical protein